MAESSIWWTTDGTGDGADTGYTMAQFIKAWRYSFCNDATTQGVLRGILNALAVSGTSSPISVASGAAHVYGFFYENSAALEVAIDTPSVGTTGHRIVLRADWAAQTVRVADLAASDGVATPPAVTQNAGTTWEISLATLTITTGGVITVTDARAYCAFSGGVVPDGIDDTMAGNRIPQLYRRQGGSATVWNTVGTTDYTPTAVRIQCGAISNEGGSFSVTFPTAYSYAPIVVAQPFKAGASGYTVTLQTVSTTGFTGLVTDGSNNPDAAAHAYWIAIGPE